MLQILWVSSLSDQTASIQSQIQTPYFRYLVIGETDEWFVLLEGLSQCILKLQWPNCNSQANIFMTDMLHFDCWPSWKIHDSMSFKKSLKALWALVGNYSIRADASNKASTVDIFASALYAASSSASPAARSLLVAFTGLKCESVSLAPSHFMIFMIIIFWIDEYKLLINWCLSSWVHPALICCSP